MVCEVIPEARRAAHPAGFRFRQGNHEPGEEPPQDRDDRGKLFKRLKDWGLSS